MKRISMMTALFLVVAFVVPEYSYGQEETVQEEKKMHHAFLLDPVGTAIGPIFGYITVAPEYQWAFNNHLALDVVPSYSYFKRNSYFTHSPLNAFGTDLGLRIYPWGKALKGFYVVPRVGISYAQGSGQSLTMIDATAEVGYSWTWGPPGLIINLGAGGGGLMSVGGNLNDTAGNYITVVANFSIGYGF